MVETVEGKRMLPVALTDRERLELGENIARVHAQIGEQKEAAKAAAEDFKARITELEKAMGLDARTLRIGKVDRLVDIEIVRNFRHGSVRVVRTDTKEEIEMRPMTSEERQQGMKF